MIESLLDQSVLRQGHEISFILGHKILAKTNHDWFELKGEALSVSEWEDLKDYLLQSNEKIQLETKGFVSGLHQSEKHSWKFSFVEKKECFRAYLSVFRSTEEIQSGIDYPLFWDTIKKEKGLFVIGGERRQGKSTLLAEIVTNDQSNKLSLTGIHSANHQQKWPQVDSVIHLGTDSIDWEYNHVLYEGVERLVVDMNSIKNWKKWIEFAEQGQSVFISLGISSLNTLFYKLASDLEASMMGRFLQVFNGAVIQKMAGAQPVAIHEILICREKEKRKLTEFFDKKQSFQLLNLSEMSFDSYHSLNQSILQKMIRRKLDVQHAFAASDSPDELDAQLKKMGL
jgi:twitching motility protein PilT